MENTAEEDTLDTQIYLPSLTGEGDLLQTTMYKRGDTKPAIIKNDDVPVEVLKAGEKIERFYRITDQISQQMKRYPRLRQRALRNRLSKKRHLWLKRLRRLLKRRLRKNRLLPLNPVADPLRDWYAPYRK